jgi:glycosyltransferase involved in cell wall biosynthesis
MSAVKSLTLSIIIPVYNEEHRLRTCLDAIAAQTEKPDEVIVVDNSSTDASMGIAKSYSFVKLLHEKQQGQSFARNTGFSAAHSDILGRIDADAVVANDWVARVKQDFADSDIDALTGLGSAVALPRFRWPKTVIWSWLYFLWMRGIFRVQVTWGANMAIRKSAWQRVKSIVINDDALVHEDQDLSLCILETGGRVYQDNQLRITTGGQSYHYLPKLVRYTLQNYRTKRLHAQRDTFKKVKRSPSLAMLALLWIFPGLPLLIAFFGFSLLLWPMDGLMRRIMDEKVWLD